MSEFELPAAYRDQFGTDIVSLEEFFNQVLIANSSKGKTNSWRDLKVIIREDTEGVGDDIIIDTDDIHKLYHNHYIYDYLKTTFFHYNWSESHDYVGLTVNIQDKSYKGYIKFYNSGQFYTIHLAAFSKDWSKRNLNSENPKDWLTDEGKVQFEALKAQFASGAAVSFGELLAPEGMMILFKYRDLYYAIDDTTHWRMSYSDFQSAIERDTKHYREIKLKEFAANDRKRLPDKKVRVYLIPDDRQVKPLNLTIEELEYYQKIGVEPPKAHVRKDSYHWELNQILVQTPDVSFRKLKEDQSGKRKYKGEQMVLLLMLFTLEDQNLYKKNGNKYLRKYVYKQIDRDEMARAILHFDTKLFSLKDKLVYIREAGTGKHVSLNSIRPILAQYPQSKQLAITHSKGRTGKDDADIHRLIRESEYSTNYKTPAYSTGNYDDVTDESVGFVGLEHEEVQDRLIRLKDLHEWYVLYKKDPKGDATTKKFKTNQEAYDLNYVESASFYYADDSTWYLKFFRDNALKIAFTILDSAEEVILSEMRAYNGEKYYQLERDFLTYQPAFEAIEGATNNLYGGKSWERGEAVRTLEARSGDMKKFLVERHPFLLDINPNGLDYNFITLLAQIYSHYKKYPESFRDFFLNKLHNSMSDHLNSIHETKDNLREDPLFVWELESLISLTRNYMHQGKDDFFDKIVQGALKKKADDEFRKTLGLTIAAITLTVVSGGIFAAGAGTLLAGTYAAGGIAITGKMVYDAHKNDQALRDAHNIGNKFTPYAALTQQDPSIGWLVLDIGLMGLDVAGVLKVFRAVSPIAKIVNNTDEVADVTLDAQKLLKQLTEDVAGFTESHALSIEKKLVARQELRDANREFQILMGSTAAANRWLDPKVSAALTKMMIKAIKVGVKTFDEFLNYFIGKQQLRKILKQYLKELPENEQKYMRIIFDDLIGKSEINIVRLGPEPQYLKGGVHGLMWPDEMAFARAAQDKKPQGKFGSIDDINFAGEKAILLDPGGFRDFPFPYNTSKVYLTDGKTIVDADMVRVRNNGDGTFHGFPINSQYSEQIYNLANFR